jgi:hypothetical protein
MELPTTEETLIAQALELYASIKHLLGMELEVKRMQVLNGSLLPPLFHHCVAWQLTVVLGCEWFNFDFLMASLKKELEDTFQVGPNWPSYTGSWGDLKACIRDLHAMVLKYQRYPTKGGHWTRDLKMIIENFILINKCLERLPLLVKGVADLQLAVADLYRHVGCQPLPPRGVPASATPSSGMRQLPLGVSDLEV